MSALVAGAVVAAAVLAAGGPIASLPGRLRQPSRPRRRGASWVVGAVAVCLVGVLPLLVSSGGGPSALFDVVGLAVITALVGWLIRRRRADAAHRRHHDSVVGLCGSLAAELHAGLPAHTALVRACSEWAEFSPVARAVRLGGDIPSALRSLAERPGAEGLRAIAAGWVVAAHSGASLARVLDRLVEGLRDQRAARAEVDAALAPPRATARMLAVLPVFGVALGIAMGADPVSFLTNTDPGRACLLTGLALALAGVAWVERLAATARRE
jgi:tight adherence protein B